MKRLLLFFIAVLVIFQTGIFSSGCANIIPPSGGPRDSLPPVLLRAEPADSTLNFRGNRITLTFDEYIDLQDVQNNLLFTPTFETNPLIEAKLRTITIRIRDTLEPNTTYTFNFGNAVRDINEANVLKNFVYTFSTGPALDSLSFSGKVVMAESGNIDTTLTILLHKNLTDSAVVKDRPRYVTRLDGSGNFTFNNLPPGLYAVYALGDAGIVRRYQSKNQAFAFADAPVAVSDSTPTIILYAYKEIVRNTTTASTSPITPGRAQRGATDRRLRYNTNLTGNQQDLLKDLVITFDQALRFLDTTKISLTTDSTFSRVSYAITLDSTKKKLTIQTTWKEGRTYNLVTDKEFAQDTLGNKLLKTDTVFFSTRKRTEYGTITLRFKNLDRTRNPVVQFVQNGVVLLSASIREGSYTNNLFVPGEYEMRILYDDNNNGIWDPGQFFGTKKQPERVYPVPRKITVKTAWDNDFEIAL